MLSILIPIYNYNCVSLASDLSEQLASIDVKAEVLFLDDHSDDEYHDENQKISDLPLVQYNRLKKNIGRAAIRNELVRLAVYECLLFLDCDSEIIDKGFVRNYLKYLESDTIVSGGRVYASELPSQDYTLHWTYGNERESKPADFRTHYPARYFHTNNFLASKDVLKQYPFDESIAGYGYEDLLFAKQLASEGITIEHVENPVLHAGLDSNEKFIAKSKNAVQNLLKLNAEGHELNTRLEKTVKRINKLGLSGIVGKTLAKREHKYVAQLSKPDPKMKYLDLLKLGWYFSQSSIS